MSFYQCNQCKRNWQYPIETCPYCFLSLNKLKSEKARVFAVSKVNIKTLLHPVIPYYVLVLENENGNKWAHKSFKEHKVGDEFVFEKDKNAVAALRIKYDIKEAVSNSIELLKGFEAKNVLVIPELDSPKHSYFRENTSPEFLEAILDYLLENNVKDIKVGAQSFDEIPIKASAQKSGLLSVCMKKGITPFDLAKTNFVKKGNLEVSEEILNADLVLNLAICKMGKAEASSNLFKVLKKENYLSLKYLSSQKEIALEINNLLKNIVSIGEAETVQRPNKISAYLGIILSSRNTLKLDRVFNEITGVKNMPEIVQDLNIQDINIVGRDIREVKYNAEIN